MPVEDIYRIRLNSSQFNRVINNVFYYERTVGNGDATLLAAAFITDVLGSIRAIQDESMVHNSVEVENLVDLNDYANAVVGLTGDLAGSEPLASFMAYYFRLNRESRLTRHGGKRFGGLNEGSVQGNNPNPAFLPLLNDVASAMGRNLVDPLDSEYRPVIYRAEKLDADGNVHLPEAINGVTSVEFVQISTQNSRKRRV